MITKKIFLIVFIILAIAGCSKGENFPTSASTLPSDSQPTILPIATTENLQLLTQTPVLLQPTISSTPTTIQTPTQFVYTASDREEFVRQLLKTNGNCHIPCFFGVIPQKTSLMEVRHLFDPKFGKGLETTNTAGEIMSYGTSFSMGDWIVGEVIFSLKSGIVQTIESQINGLNKDNVNQDEWSAFSLKNILNKYGAPSNVIFMLEGPHEPPYNQEFVYSYSLLYKEYNTAITYMGGRISIDSLNHLCLSDERPELLRIEIGNRDFVNIGEGVEITKAASISPKDFYNMFSDPNNKNCINLNIKSFN